MRTMLTLGAAVLVSLGLGEARASVTMALVDPNGSTLGFPPGVPGDAFCEYSGLSAYLGNNQIINGTEWIGIYQFTVAAGSSPALSNPFYAICLSPEGVLTDGNYTYVANTVAGANPGLNPASWASGTVMVNGQPQTQYWGSENAAFLYNTYSKSIINKTSGLMGSGADQGTALAMALYAALNNSTTYGVLGGNSFVLKSANANVIADYSTILGDLSSWNSSDLVAADANAVLVPDTKTQQDMILLTSGMPSGSPSVPEPATVLAGMLLFLPFCASAFRIIRNRKMTVV